MSYTDVFGGNTIYPSDVSLLRLVLNTDYELEWPLEASGDATPLARIIEAAPTVSGHKVKMPDATAAAPGQTVLFDNRSVSANFEVVDHLGGNIMTVEPGTQWQTYLGDNPTPAGLWFSFRFGASTATVQPSALAGYGLTVTGTTLSVAVPVYGFNANTNVSVSNRATAFVWVGAGAGTLNLLSAPSAGYNFIFHVRNQGGGALTIDPAGSEVINGAANLILQVGDSASVFTDGTSWFTIGLGQNPVFAFDYTSINVAPGGEHTLAGSELNRIAYLFTGALTSNATVIVPPTVQQYWINNATTGAFSLSIKVAGGSAYTMTPAQKGIFYSDGTNMILASDPVSIATPVSIGNGGTGATNATAARGNLGISTFIDPFVTATNAAAARSVIGAAAAGANTDISSLGPMTINGGLTVAGGASIRDGLSTGENGSINMGHLGRFNLTSDAAGGAGSLIYNSNGDISLWVGGTRMYIRSDGFVGIGRTDPGVMLDVNGDIRGATFHGAGTYLSGTAASLTVGAASTATLATNANNAYACSGNSATATLAANANNAYACSGNSATATTASNSNQLGGQGPGFYLTYQTGVWKNSDDGYNRLLWLSGSNSYYKSPLGHIFRRNDDVDLFTIDNAGNATAAGNLAAYSDRKLKSNLAPITKALAKVLSLTGCTFDRVDAPELGRQTGLIAQDVQAVLPEAVGEADDGTLTLAYGNLAGLFVEAFKDMQSEIDALRREISYLRTGSAT